MSCGCCGFDELFDRKTAAKELRRYRRKGPIRSTAALIALLKERGVENASLLDVGGGIGAIQHELLDAGAARAVDVDGSAAYLDAAREEAERRGRADRHVFHEGDFAEIADAIDDADIVTLDRVICCYPDMPTLVASSAVRARRLYGLVFPRRHLAMRVAHPLINLMLRLKRCPMRFHLHDPVEVRRVVGEAGLERAASRRTFLWTVEIYRRRTA
jgi:magnesium-protoporphyrin O-methyltransferase